MNESKPRQRRHLVVTPAPSTPRLRSAVRNIECAEDEDVEWDWTQAPEGRFVSGYRVVPRLSKSRG